MQPLTLPSVCDRAAANAIYSELCDALSATPQPVDASEVRKIGQAMLQVLVAAQRTEGGIAITAVSHDFVAATKLAGLDDVLSEETAR